MTLVLHAPGQLPGTTRALRNTVIAWPCGSAAFRTAGEGRSGMNADAILINNYQRCSANRLGELGSAVRASIVTASPTRRLF